MLAENRVREIIRTESGDGGGCIVLAFIVLLCFIFTQLISEIDYRFERIENKTGIPVCKVWSIRNMRCE